MAEATFYRSNKCGCLVYVLHKGACDPTCCGEPMEELKAGSTDAATEKHVPVVSVADGKLTVKVGDVAHPMLEEHYIQWIALVTEDSVSIKYLKPGEAPEATFDAVESGTVYEYCNLHGLWKTEF